MPKCPRGFFKCLNCEWDIPHATLPDAYTMPTMRDIDEIWEYDGEC